MILQELLKYDFAKDFVEGKIKEHKFLLKLISKIKSDEEFRLKTQIFSTEVEELRKVADEVYIIKIRREKAKAKSRRGFLKTAAATAAGVFAFGTRAFAQEKKEDIDARKLFEEISKIPQLKPVRPPIFSNRAGSLTIIIVEDIHGGKAIDEGWSIEYVQVELLRQKFGLSLVGIEGWAGHEVDKKRGVRILNGETILVGTLINNKNYNLVGLEDENAQRYPAIAKLPELYDKLHAQYNSIAEMLKDFGVGKDVFDGIIRYFHDAYGKFNPQNRLQDGGLELYKIGTKCRNYFFRKTNLPTHEDALAGLRKANNALKKWNDDADKLLKSRIDEKIYAEMIDKRDKLSAQLIVAQRRLIAIDSLNYAVGNYLIILEELYQELYLGFLVTKFNDKNLKACEPLTRDIIPKLLAAKPQNRPLGEYYVLDFRNVAAVKKMLQAMNGHSKKIGVVVFGKGHTPGLIDEFLKQANNRINILVIQ